MKTKLPIFIFLALVLVSCGDKKNQAEDGNNTTPESGKNTSAPVTETPKGGLFGIKSAKITYDYHWAKTTGKEIFWFDDFGNTAVLEIDHKEQYGEKKQTLIWKDNKGLVINHTNKNAAKTGFRSKDTEPPTLVTTPEEDLKRVGYEKLPNEDVAGRSCIVWNYKAADAKYWIWNNIELKSTNNTIERTAISVEENITIPANLFEVPAGYKQ